MPKVEKVRAFPGRQFKSQRSLLRVTPSVEYTWVSPEHFDFVYAGEVELKFRVRVPGAYVEVRVLARGGELLAICEGTCKDKKLGPQAILDWLLEHAEQTNTDPDLVRATIKLFLSLGTHWA